MHSKLPRKIRPQRAKRINKVMALRLEGYTFRAIANTLQIDVKRAYEDYRIGIRDTYKENAEQVRTLELERYDLLLASLWERAIKGELQAVDRVLVVMSRIDRLNGVEEARHQDNTQYVHGMLELLLEGSLRQ